MPPPARPRPGMPSSEMPTCDPAGQYLLGKVTALALSCCTVQRSGVAWGLTTKPSGRLVLTLRRDSTGDEWDPLSLLVVSMSNMATNGCEPPRGCPPASWNPPGKDTGRTRPNGGIAELTEDSRRLEVGWAPSLSTVTSLLTVGPASSATAIGRLISIDSPGLTCSATVQTTV